MASSVSGTSGAPDTECVRQCRLLKAVPCQEQGAINGRAGQYRARPARLRHVPPGKPSSRPSSPADIHAAVAPFSRPSRSRPRHVLTSLQVSPAVETHPALYTHGAVDTHTAVDTHAAAAAFDTQPRQADHGVYLCPRRDRQVLEGALKRMVCWDKAAIVCSRGGCLKPLSVQLRQPLSKYPLG